MSSGRISWVLLAYRLPREPSTPRSALWRKLRRLGAVQVLDGLAALPLDARNREQLEWLADEVLESGGEATIWVGELASAAQERELASRMASGVAAEYRALIADASAARSERAGGGAAPSLACAASCVGSGRAITFRRRSASSRNVR